MIVPFALGSSFNYPLCIYNIKYHLSLYFSILQCLRFNKREDDFPSLREYNDYLEEVEDMSKFINCPSRNSECKSVYFDKKKPFCFSI